MRVIKLIWAELFFLSFTLLAPLIMLPRVFRDRRVRFLVMAAMVLFAGGLGVETWFHSALCGAVHGTVFRNSRAVHAPFADVAPVRPAVGAVSGACPIDDLHRLGFLRFCAPTELALLRIAGQVNRGMGPSLSAFRVHIFCRSWKTDPAGSSRLSDTLLITTRLRSGSTTRPTLTIPK